MDVQLTWILILIAVVIGIAFVVLLVVLDINERTKLIEKLKAQPLSDQTRDLILSAIKDRDEERSVIAKAAEARMRDLTKLTRDFLNKLNRVFWPESPPSPPVSKRPDSPDTKD